MPKAYVQIDTKGDSNKEIAIIGLKECGYTIEECSRYLDISQSLDKTHVFYGGVGFIKSICQQYGYKYNPIGEVPEAMLPFSGRKIFECTLERALALSKTTPLFIKPTSDHNKGFQGIIIGDRKETGSYDPHTYLTEYYLKPTDRVIASTVVEFVSEWRYFVLKDNVLDVVHYKGDKDFQPSEIVILSAVCSWKEKSLIAYACDIGVTSNGETLVVECNDLPSLGLYGVTPIVFGGMLSTRWNEIHQDCGFIV